MKLGLLFRKERVENFVIKKFNRLIINNEVLEKFVMGFGIEKTMQFPCNFGR